MDPHRSQNPKIQNLEHKDVHNQGGKQTQHNKIKKGHKKQRVTAHRATNLTVTDKTTERGAGGTIEGGDGMKSDPKNLQNSSKE